MNYMFLLCTATLNPLNNRSITHFKNIFNEPMMLKKICECKFFIQSFLH